MFNYNNKNDMRGIMLSSKTKKMNPNLPLPSGPYLPSGSNHGSIKFVCVESSSIRGSRQLQPVVVRVMKFIPQTSSQQVSGQKDHRQDTIKKLVTLTKLEKKTLTKLELKTPTKLQTITKLENRLYKALDSYKARDVNKSRKKTLKKLDLETLKELESTTKLEKSL